MFLDLWLHKWDLHLSSHGPLLLIVSSLLSLIKTLVIGLRAHPDNLKIPNLIISISFFLFFNQIKSHSYIPGTRMWT